MNSAGSDPPLSSLLARSSKVALCARFARAESFLARLSKAALCARFARAESFLARLSKVALCARFARAESRLTVGRVSPFGHLRIDARLPAPRSFSQVATSFVACNRQGIHHMHFGRLTP